MKTILKSLVILTAALGTVAFTNTISKKINVQNSTIEWKGKKVLGSHTGTIKLKEGHLEMEGQQLTGGMFVVDMTTINVTDLEGESKGKLEGHLKSDDFFGIAEYPTATFTITTTQKMAGRYELTGNMTIKGHTEEIKMDMEVGSDFASASFKVDRTKYGVQYGSGSFFDGLGDRAISDNFELNVMLKF
ncbi:YceI family protein [Patiriisocius sp. Uisw_017]|jgi:polyisoprenoid-binding protein YceI|uniref:YceI family protein n=1 Tax=Patiriisocius sp. Uisw_017 TaxID=3230968 RepID=UPI0039EC62CC